MTTWIQSSDYSCKDIESLDNFDKFASFINTFPTDKLDAEMAALQERKQDYCTWGIGINMDTGNGIHVCREDPKSGTYYVLLSRTVKRKLLGFIPIDRNLEDIHQGLTKDEMLKIAEEYYNNLKAAQQF